MEERIEERLHVFRVDDAFLFDDLGVPLRRLCFGLLRKPANAALRVAMSEAR